VSTMAAMGEWRGALGWSSSNASIWRRTSGEQLQSTHPLPVLTAIESWVRASIPGRPLRTARQFSQPQFHWGTPPPAPEPKIRIRMSFIYQNAYAA